ncbi:hypothetical protein ACLOJK_012758 [Asimina triloba]
MARKRQSRMPKELVMRVMIGLNGDEPSSISAVYRGFVENPLGVGPTQDGGPPEAKAKAQVIPTATPSAPL